MLFILREAVSFRLRKISPPNDYRLSTCFWMVLGERSEATKSARSGRKQAPNLSAGGRSFSQPIHECGQFPKPRQ